MPLNIKSFTEFFRLINGKFNKEIPEIDPTIKASLGRASSASTAAAGVGLEEGLKDAVDQTFPQTADGEFLELIGSYDKTFRFDPQISRGIVSVSGALGTSIPQNTPLTARGNTYISSESSIVNTFTGSISLSYSAGIVTAISSATHSLATGIEVTITGATQPDYNGTFIVTALSDTEFTYELIAGSLTTDNGTYTSIYGLLNVQSQEPGSNQNIESGGLMTIDLTGLNTSAIVGIEGVEGGLNEELIEDYRVRVIEAHSLTPGISTPPSEVFSIKQIAGNTRVFVVRPDGTSGGIKGQAGYKPDYGETVIYLLRDNDPTIIPSIQDLDDAKAKVLSDGLWPSFLPTDNLYVLAPILQNQDFNFTLINPNTSTMQTAIRDQLVSFFEDNSEIEGTITLESINSFLQQVQDSTGTFLRQFEYNNPSADIVAGSGEIYTVGQVVFA